MSSPPPSSPAASSHLRITSPSMTARTPTLARDHDQSSMVSNADVDAEIDELLSDGERAGKECQWADCPEVFEEVDQLVHHLHTDHIPGGKETLPKDTPWSCEWSGCPRKGQPQSNRHSLITHCRTHTGERPYSCKQPGCPKTFVRSDAMNKHFRTVHGPNGDKPPPPKKEKPPPKEKRPKPVDDALTTSVLREPVAPIASSSKPGVIIDPVTGRSIPFNPSYPINWTEVLDAGLYEDSDLSEAINIIQKNEPFWSMDDIDLAVIKDFRRRFPRDSTTPDFDEGVKDNFPADPTVLETVPDPDAPDTDVHLLSRPRWQVRYMMAKAKLMLVDEENRMRRYQLYELMKMENELEADAAKLKENGGASEEDR